MRMHSRCAGGGQKGERMRNSSQQRSESVSGRPVEETRPRGRGAETHCGVLSIARGDSRQAARGKGTALSQGPSHDLCKGSSMPCTGGPPQLSTQSPVELSACPSESQGAARSRAAFPVWPGVS